MTSPGGYAVDLEEPAPPPGPGVNPPFAAPPADRNWRGLWIGLGVGAAVLALCCIGGVFGIGVLVASVNHELETQAQTVVGSYLDALRDADYDTAYDLQCPSLTDAQSRADFATAQRDLAPPVSYTVGKPRIGNTVVVPADVQYNNGAPRRLTFTLVGGSSTTELKVCQVTG
jgi:hypothetical protein